MKTLYEILGVEADAPAEMIKRAYRTLVKTAHPDAGGDPDEFVAIVHAYEVLMDADKRAYYDAHGVEPEAPADADQEAIHIITITLSNIIGGGNADLEMTDVLAAMKTDIGAALNRSINLTTRTKKSIERLTKLRKKFKHKGKGINIIDGQIGMQIAACEQQLAYSSEERKSIERALEMLETYTFDSGWAGFTTQPPDPDANEKLLRQYKLAAGDRGR